MKRFFIASAVLAVLGVTVTVLAQPPAGGPPEGPPGAGGPGGPGGRGGHPIVIALDLDGDHEISAEELNAAKESLLKLDKNGDGKLTGDEIRPARLEGPGGREGRGNGRPQGEEGPPPPPPPREDGPPPHEDGPPPPGPGGRGPGGFGQGPGQGPGGAGGRGPGGPGGMGQGRPGQGGGRPDPVRLVEDAMRFDADKDGKLSKEELMRFAEEFTSRQGPPGGQDGPGPGGQGGAARGPGAGGGGGGRGPGGAGGPGAGGRGGNQNGEPAQRPRRPDSDN